MTISRSDIYTYVASLFATDLLDADGNVLRDKYGIILATADFVLNNIYWKEVPQTLTATDVSKGFMVMKLQQISDNSEMLLETYCDTRMYIECYVPSIKASNISGVINKKKYDAIQKVVDEIILSECKKVNQPYTISRDVVLSMDDFYTNGTNTFFQYITSFKIII